MSKTAAIELAVELTQAEIGISWDLGEAVAEYVTATDDQGKVTIDTDKLAKFHKSYERACRAAGVTAKSDDAIGAAGRAFALFGRLSWTAPTTAYRELAKFNGADADTRSRVRAVLDSDATSKQKFDRARRILGYVKTTTDPDAPTVTIARALKTCTTLQQSQRSEFVHGLAALVQEWGLTEMLIADLTTA